MRKAINIIGLLIVGILAIDSYSQDVFNGRRSVRLVIKDSVQLDTLSIVPGSVFLYGKKGFIQRNKYRVDFSKSTIYNESLTELDTIEIHYQVFPFQWEKKDMHKDIRRLQVEKAYVKNPFRYSASKTNLQPSFGNLNKQGSISRGISFGNSQDLSVSSSLNLQLAGAISEEVNVRAVISDENIPIQPEGNTQQIQDFDQVFIELFNENNTLRVGDFQLQEKQAYYMRYWKKAQGGSYKTKNPFGQENVYLQVSGAASRGKFSRNIVQGVEGNQGPYRLTGAENEQFIIILSGTERVFIDGALLTRGLENDYVIDYNTAEITFTAKQLITKDKRIVVEFQYSNRNYTRSIVEGKLAYQDEKLNTYFQVYSEQDHKNQPILTDLTDPQRQFLIDVGDDYKTEFFPGYDSIGFTDEEILYDMIDSLGYDSVFVYSTDPEEAVYRVLFSKVTSGQGDYIQEKSTANGRVFKWVKPDTNGAEIIHRGNYAPIIQLIAPTQKQMAIWGGTFTTGNPKRKRFTQVTWEFAGSKFNQNTFSSKDTEDDYGLGTLVQLKRVQKLSADSNKHLLLTPYLEYEFIHRDFSQIERYRNVEFFRNWNLRGVSLKNNQHISHAGIALQNEKMGKLIGYGFRSFLAENNEYTGIRQELSSAFSDKNWQVNHRSFWMQSSSNFASETGNKNSISQSDFIQSKGIISRRMYKDFRLGVRNDFERNLILNSADSLLGQSYQFFEIEGFGANSDTAKIRYELKYILRDEWLPQNDALGKATRGETVGGKLGIGKKQNRLDIISNYRVLKIENTELTSARAEETFLNRVEYQFSLLDRFIRSQSFYEIASGLEAKQEFQFVEVADGQGTYTWIDYDSSGTKELNEFEVAIFQDQADHIKVLRQTTDYVKTYTNQFSQSLQIGFDRLVRKKKNWKWLGKLSTQSSFRVSWKRNDDQFPETYNPLTVDLSDTSVIDMQKSLRNTVYLNRNQSKWGLFYTYSEIQGKNITTNGFEGRTKKSDLVEGRLALTTLFLLKVTGERGNKRNFSEFFTARNFHIDYRKIKPTFTFQPGNTFRVELGYEYTHKLNRAEYGGHFAELHSGIIEAKYSQVEKGALLTQGSVVHISYQSPENQSSQNSIGYEMLQGLQPGVNYTWSVNYQRNLSGSIQLTLSYNGRKSPESKFIHVGQAEVRAFF